VVLTCLIAAIEGGPYWRMDLCRAAGRSTLEQWPVSAVVSAWRRRSSGYSTRLPITPLPIGLGTRFRARMGKAGGEMPGELTEFERPHRLSSRTASSMM
jgi:hypothetical protein